MGVTVHFFAYDPNVYTLQPTMNRWLDWGELDEGMEIQGKARAWLKEIPSRLGDNKRWYDNLSADTAWSRSRRHVPEPARARIDHWLSHLMWRPAPGTGCGCEQAPREVAEQQVVFDDPLLRHILSLEHDLQPVEAALLRLRQEEPDLAGLYGRPWPFEYEGFTNLVWEHQSVFERATRAGAGWSLLRWVWI